MLLRGLAGAGKSDLALRLVSQCPAGPARATQAPGLMPSYLSRPKAARDAATDDDGVWRLVSDDQVLVQRLGDRLVARPPAAIAAKLEVRGVGIIEFEHLAQAEIVMVADLVPQNAVTRFPDLDDHVMLQGVRLPLQKVWPFEPSAPLKVLLFLQANCCSV